MIVEETRRIRDKVPVLGSVPLVGRFFRAESQMTVRKCLLLFVTPTIVDSAGNPVNSRAAKAPAKPDAAN